MKPFILPPPKRVKLSLNTNDNHNENKQSPPPLPPPLKRKDCSIYFIFDQNGKK